MSIAPHVCRGPGPTVLGTRFLEACVYVVISTFASPFVATVSAHPIIDAGIEATNDGRFDEALASFASAWHGDGLERDEVVTLLVYRAIVHFAVRASAELDQDLGWLAALDPNYVFPRNVPPQLRRRFELLRTEAPSPTLSVALDFEASGTRFTTSLSGMPDALVRTIRVLARPVRGAWVSGEGREIQLPITDTSAIDWYVEVVGPGGAVIASEGDAASPRRALDPRLVVATTRDVEASGPRDANRSRSGMWWAVGGGAAAVVLGTVLFVVLRDPSTNTYVTDPVIR